MLKCWNMRLCCKACVTSCQTSGDFTLHWMLFDPSQSTFLSILCATCTLTLSSFGCCGEREVLTHVYRSGCSTDTLSNYVLEPAMCVIQINPFQDSSGQFSPLTDWIVGGTWGIIQQRSSSSLFSRRPLWAVLAWLGMSTFWCCPSSISSADHSFTHPPRCPNGWFWRGCCGVWHAESWNFPSPDSCQKRFLWILFCTQSLDRTQIFKRLNILRTKKCPRTKRVFRTGEVSALTSIHRGQEWCQEWCAQWSVPMLPLL